MSKRCSARRAVLTLLSALLPLIACQGSPARPRHLLLVSVDTLRVDRLGVYGSPLGLTPNLDALAREGETFTRAFAPAPFTLASVSALLTGRYPEELGATRNTMLLPRGLSTLATEFYGRGFRTGAVVSNFVLRRRVGLAGGFETYDDRYPQLEASRPTPERSGGDTTDAALRLLDELRAGENARVFLWVHYQDPHGPYTPPEGYRERYLEVERSAPDGRRRLPRASVDGVLGAIPAYQSLPESNEVAFYRAGYDGEVRYLDEQLGRLLAGLADRGMERETAVAFTADHGESLGENDLWFAHGSHLSEALLRVPLVLRVPGRPPRLRHDLVSLLDLAPTLLSLVTGARVAGLPGRDLLAPGAARERGSVYVNALGSSKVPRFGLIRDDFKYVVEERGEAIRERLVRLGEEDRDRSDEDPERLRALREELRELRASLQPREPRPQTLGPGERERLRALGYVGGD